MHRIRVNIFIFLSAILFSCSPKVYQQSALIMGTVIDIQIIDRNRDKAHQAIDKTIALLKNIEQDLSYTDPQSFLSHINAEAFNHPVALPEDLYVLIEKTIELSEKTYGAFDVTFYPLWDLWKKCESEQRLPTSPEIKRAQSFIGYKKVKLNETDHSVRLLQKGISIHLGGIAKGYALIKCKQLLKELSINNALINLGGDIVAIGDGKKGNGWVVGVQDPCNEKNVIEKITLKNKAVLTSGIYQRFVEINGTKYHHLIDARTGYPVEGFTSITLVIDDIEKKYIPSAVIFLSGKDEGLNLLKTMKDISYYIILDSGEVLSNRFDL